MVICCALFSPAFAYDTSQICRNAEGWYIHPSAPWCLVNDNKKNCVECGGLYECVRLEQCSDGISIANVYSGWSSAPSGDYSFECDINGALGGYSWTALVPLQCDSTAEPETCPAGTVNVSTVPGKLDCQCPGGAIKDKSSTDSNIVCRCPVGTVNKSTVYSQFDCQPNDDPAQVCHNNNADTSQFAIHTDNRRCLVEITGRYNACIQCGRTGNVCSGLKGCEAAGISLAPGTVREVDAPFACGTDGLWRVTGDLTCETVTVGLSCQTGYYNASGDSKNPQCTPCPQPNGLQPDSNYGYVDAIKSDGNTLESCSLSYMDMPYWEDDTGYFELNDVCAYKTMK